MMGGGEGGAAMIVVLLDRVHSLAPFTSPGEREESYGTCGRPSTCLLSDPNL